MREDDRPYLPPGYLVAIRVAGAMQSATFTGGMCDLFEGFFAVSAEGREDGHSRVIDALWDIEFDWDCAESLAERFHNIGFNVVSDPLIRHRDALTMLVPAGHLERRKACETLANALLVGGIAQELQSYMRQQRRTDSRDELPSCIADWAQKQVPADASGAPLVQVKHVAISAGKVSVAVALHPGAGGLIEQINLHAPWVQ